MSKPKTVEVRQKDDPELYALVMLCQLLRPLTHRKRVAVMRKIQADLDLYVVQEEEREALEAAP